MASGYKAEGGFDVPSGLSPNTQLHPEEMVLPAKIANPLRQSLANGELGSNSGGAGGRGGGDTHLHLQGMATRDILKSMRRGGVLEKAARDLHRRTSRKR
jgi:hypothetical protein